ncbi:hypothetical protein K9L67_03285 [Candidatus Woesearchaeota archaeon]|nr:hypothetical protein [Candidatus Woesearchaeota archaeon]MCF7901225.1 hypothetical protein [Candidatus Woesearchaeota archaeon]MCF8013754.1 hypothetical protein [Candidatus Woesearchaeota archaeon]
MEKKPSITINNNKIILSDGRQYQIKNIKHIFLPGNHLGFIATNEQDYENISKCINKINQLFKNYSNSLACGLTRSLIYWNAINQLRKKIKPIRILNHKDMLKNLKVPYNKSKYGLIIINQR